MDDFEEEFENIREQNEDKVFSTLIVGNPGMGKTYYLKNKMDWNADDKLSNHQTRYIKRKIKNLQKGNKNKIKEISNLKLNIKDYNDWVYELEKLIKDDEDKINKLKFKVYRKVIYLNCFEIQNNFSKSIFCEFIQKKIFSRWSRFMYKLNQLLISFWVYVLVPYLGLIGGLMGIFFGADDKKYWPIYLIFAITIILLIAVLYNVTYVSKTNFNSRNTNEISNKYFVDFENLIIIFDDLDRLQDNSLKRNITNEISLFRDKMINVFLGKNKNHWWSNLFIKKKLFSCSVIAVTNYEEKPVEEINQELAKINGEFEILNRNLKNIEDGIDKIGFYIPSISPNNPHNVGSYFSQRGFTNRGSKNSSSILSINYEENLIDFYNKNFDFIYEAAINDLRAKDLIYSALKKYEKLNNYENEIEEFFNSQINKNYWELIIKKFNVRKINMVFPIIHSLLKSKTNINWLKIIFPDDDFFIYTVIDYAILRVYQPTHFFEQKKQLSLSLGGARNDDGEKISVFKRMFYSVEMREIVYNIFSQLTMSERADRNIGWDIEIFKEIANLFETHNKISLFNLQKFLLSLRIKINEIFLHFFYIFLINDKYFEKIDFFSDSTSGLLNDYSTKRIYIIRFFIFFRLQNAFDGGYKINNLIDILKINKEVFNSFTWERKKLIFKFLIGEADQLSSITFSYDDKEDVFHTSENFSNNWFDNPFFLELDTNKQNETFPGDSVFIRKKKTETTGPIRAPSWVTISLFKTKQLNLMEHYDLSLIIEAIDLDQEKFSDKKILAAELIDIFSLNDFDKEDYGYISKWEEKERLFSVFIYMINKRMENFSAIEYADLYKELNCKFSFGSLLVWLRSDWILVKEKSKNSLDFQNYQELLTNLEQVVSYLKEKNS